MKNEKDKKRKGKAIPFFTRYLENQNTLKIKTNVKAGGTLKYPSDSDEISG